MASVGPAATTEPAHGLPLECDFFFDSGDALRHFDPKRHEYRLRSPVSPIDGIVLGVLLVLPDLVDPVRVVNESFGAIRQDFVCLFDSFDFHLYVTFRLLFSSLYLAMISSSETLK